MKTENLKILGSLIQTKINTLFDANSPSGNRNRDYKP